MIKADNRRFRLISDTSNSKIIKAKSASFTDKNKKFGDTGILSKINNKTYTRTQ